MERKNFWFGGILVLVMLVLGGCSEQKIIQNTSQSEIVSPQEGQNQPNEEMNKKLTIGDAPKQNQPNEASKEKSSVPTGPTTPEKLNSNQPPKMEIDQSKSYSAKLKTSVGEIILELNAKTTPITVNNFVSLARKNFYNGTIFHRVIKDFMIQGGDPKGDGTGGPGYKFDDEPIEGDYDRGVLAMANSGPNTNGSQFFIMHKKTDLPKNYVIFGKVVSGLEIVDKIAEAPVQKSESGEMSKPIDPVVVESIEIIEK